MLTKHFIFPLAVVALLFVSCSKDPTPPTDDTSASSYTDEEEWEWKNASRITQTIDTVWTPDTTMNI